ncbi:putative EF-hand domain pair protein CML [Helianthus anomalus]
MQSDADEEQQTALIPKESPNDQSSILEFLEALFLVLFGSVLTFVVATPLKTNIVNFAYDANVPSFLISYVIIPCASNISRLLSEISSARQKTERAASLTLSQVNVSPCPFTYNTHKNRKVNNILYILYQYSFFFE